MVNKALIGLINFTLIIGISIGYFASISISGNTVLVKNERGENIQSEPEKITESKKEVFIEEKPCRNVVCNSTVRTCADGSKAECKNSCIEGKCAECNPDCSKDEKVDVPSTIPKVSIAQIPSDSEERCKPNWSCSDWSECGNGLQTRPCKDLSNCGSDQGKPSETQTCQISENQKVLALTISTNNQTIIRGNEVEITVKTTESQNPLEGSGVEIKLTYASGTEHITSGLTDSTGLFSWTKLIGGNSKIGTFKIDVKANKTGYSDASNSVTFEVTGKTS